MAMNFKEVSKRAGLVESDILMGRDPLPLSEVMGEELVLIGVARTHWKKNGEEGDRPGMIFEEYPENWVKASGVNIQRNIYAWAEQAGCPADPDTPDCPFVDFDALNAELKAAGGVHVMFTRGKTSGGNPFNKMNIL